MFNGNSTRNCKNMWRGFVSANVSTKIKAALIQSRVVTDKSVNLANATEMIGKAKQNGGELIVLPECFNSPYGTKHFAEYAEAIPDGPTSRMMSDAAKKHSIYLVGGTIPEKDGGKFYNTCTVWNPDGEIIAKYRKMHLFDVDIPDKITFKESESLSAGDQLVTFNVKDLKVGLGICYDIRFEEIAKLYRLAGCKLLIYPAAFSVPTGKMHWELLTRSRANDNQVYVIGVSPASGDLGYVAWGHSMVTDPWGKVIVSAGHDETILYADIIADECDNVRRQIPVVHQRRADIYDTIVKGMNLIVEPC